MSTKANKDLEIAVMKEEFKELFKANPKKYNEFIMPLIFKSKLDDSLEEKNSTRKIKI